MTARAPNTCYLRYHPSVSSEVLTGASPLLLRRRPVGDDRTSHLGRDALAAAGVIPGEAWITVKRESPDDVGFREIFMSLNGESVGMLRAGESLTVETSAGPHRLRAHNTLFWKTHHLVLHAGEHVHFNAVNRAGWGTFGMLFVIGAMPVYLTFERDLSHSVADDRRN
jgi:hypothetical protein